MSETRVKIQSIVENQLPDFVAEENPLLVEFLKQYYISQEYPSGTTDLVANLDKYLKLDEIFKSVNTCLLQSDVDYGDTTINVSTSYGKDGEILTGTKGFPDRYGIIKINDEIITYTGKTETSFTGCIRGFSGVTGYSKPNSPEELIFSTSKVQRHILETYSSFEAPVGPIVYNLSGLFFTEFLKKLKQQFVPGFADRNLDSDLNENLFIKQSKDFYSSKGTDRSFEILFGALYGETVEVVKPRDYLFRPSDAGWRRTKDLVVEAISGDPLDLLNNTLYQDADANYGITEAYAAVTDVEKIAIGATVYYKLSFDADYNKDLILDGTVYGDFSVHPKSLVVTAISAGSTTIDVDSTVGFAQSGELVLKYDSGLTGIASYSSKSITQFFGIASTAITAGIGTASEIRLNAHAYGYSGITTDDPITVRIGSVLEDVVIPESTYLFANNDTARVKTLGISSSTIRRENWVDNLSNSYEISSFTLIDTSNSTYEITLYNTHNFRIGDTALVTRDDTVKTNCEIISIISDKKCYIRGQGELSTDYDYSLQRNLTKVESNRYAYLNKYNANIQNTYTNLSNDVVVASPSLPSYNDQLLNPYDRKLILSGSYSGTEIDVIANDSDAPADHGFYTGDRIYYQPYVVTSETRDTDGFVSISTATSKFPEMEEGLYFVKRVNSTTLSFAKSPSNISSGDFINVTGIVTSNIIQDFDFAKKQIWAQNILKEIKDPVNRSGDYVTEAGKTGVFINGVELLNYKSLQTLFYGSIDKVELEAKGSGYDIINPPSLDITDSAGVGATGICAVKGALERMEIIDSGFDYLDRPFITITGGNGKGAAAEVNMKSVVHSVSFDATNNGTDGDVFIQAGSASTSLIGFSTYHKFRDYEKVIYDTDKQTALTGLTTDSTYRVAVVNAKKIRLHPTEADAIAGINTVYITAYGTGRQEFRSSEKKDIVSDIVVTDSGEGYQNKKRTTRTSGVSTSLDTINIDDHGYETGEEVTYATTGTAIDGLNTSLKYLVKKIDVNSFKLASVGLGTTSQREYLDSGQYIDLKSIGSGVHSFNYPVISATITGNIGVSTLANQDFFAKIQPIFRGSIESVHLTDKGSKYGSDSILNWDRQPEFDLRSGKNAQVRVVTNEGKIIEVIVVRGGSGYNTPPNIVINGTGDFARLTPVVQDGVLQKINVLNGGTGYDNTTTLTIKAPGSQCRMRADLQKWTVNLFQKYKDTFSGDDGVLDESDRSAFGLQYCHLYAPRKLRESTYVRGQSGVIVYGTTDIPQLVEGDIKYGVGDLRLSGNEEQPSSYHSPILGYAYDGNPIYGPYGYTTPEGGIPRALLSGYKAVSKTNRPPLSNFPQGFFNEDYEFKDVGDLDEHNGRFGITPEYPNGVYAYFTTIKSGPTDTDGAFQGFFQPAFPYVIGTTFYSQPNSLNFSDEFNQESYDLNNSGWFRNTLNYRFKSSNSSYNFVFDPDSIKSQIVNIDYASTGTVDSIGILTGGKDYNLNDRVLFDNSLTGGTNAAAKVSNLHGKALSAVSASTTSFSNVEFATLDAVGNIVGFTTSPHGFKNAETLHVSGLSTYYAKIGGSYTIGIRTDNFITTLGIGSTNTTGLTTYFYTTGFLDFPFVRENDILGIGNTEKVRVLNVDQIGKRIRVQRAVNGTVGFAYSASTLLRENPRKFTINTGFKTDRSYSPNREIYFDPNESVGIGTSAIAGIGSTVVFSMPGLGATSVFVPYSQIYLPNHGLKTGEKVTYSNHGGEGLGCWHPITGITSGTTFELPEGQDLYIANFGRDFIGVSTVKVGLGTTGVFVGVGSTTTQRLPYFTGVGTVGAGKYHSFTTKRTVITGEIGQNIITAVTSLGSTHGLTLGDTIEFTALPKDRETITVKYDNDNRRAIFKPQTWVAGSVSTTDDTITISNHGLKTGDKVIYTASSASGGLTNEGIYYVLYYTKDKIRLCASRYDLNLNIPNYIDITSATAGTISLVNPEINVYKNKIIKFDLSDSSLSSKVGLTTYSAFALNFYKDPQYNYQFESTATSGDFEVVTTGKPGFSGANVEIFLNDNVPENFYYKLDIANEDLIADVKKEIIVDTDVYNNNQINLIESRYSGSHRIVGLGTTTFTYNLNVYPEASSYDSSTANFYYTTKSTSVYGGIKDIEVLNGGRKYQIAPGVTTISSAYGKDAILEIKSTTIGKVEKDSIEDIGFDYPSDNTLKPSLNLPEILKIEPLTSFGRIGISSGGKNYLTDPSLVVLDGYTGKVVDDVELEYQVGSTQVRIIKNTYGMYNVLPTIIPIHNSNGVGINTITYNSSTKKVTVGFNTGFSDIFPFAVGDKVLIENTSVGVASTAKGYNSSAYNYKLFPITEVNENLGGNTGSLVYDMTDVLEGGEYPGYFDYVNSVGRIIPQKDFPIFDIHIKTNDFLEGEKVVTEFAEGIVERWNNKIETVKVSTNKDLKVGSILTGETSNTKGVIKSKTEFDSYIELGPYSQVNKGWIYDTGILNNNVQRLPDNDYYQYFSYALKSKVPYQTWNGPVSSLNHTSGFLKFSDLVIETTDDDFRGVFGNDSNTEVTVDMMGEGHLHCVNTFDLASEETVKIGSTLVSNTIIFENRVLTDYFESVGNRVLTIDDFSGDFNHLPRSTKYAAITDVKLTANRAKKYFTYVRDTRYTQERQVMIVSLIHDGSQGYINQYGRVETHPDLGSFDWRVSGNEGQLLFYPVKYKKNNYDITFISHDIADTVTGIGSTALGSIVHINSHQASIANGSSAATTIVGIASTYRSAKVLVEIGSTTTDPYYEFDELNLIHDGSTVDLVEYGQLTEGPSNFAVGGLGTYYPYIDGSRIKIDFTPNAGVSGVHTVNSLSISIASSTSTATGVGTATELQTGLLDSWYTSIAASSTPGINTIAEYHADSHAAYYIVQLEDTTNKRYEMCEVIACDDDDYNALTEYGNVRLHTTGLGTIGANIDGSERKHLTFIPNHNIKVQVRVFQNVLSLVKDDIDTTSIDLENASINSKYGEYRGTETDIKRTFGLLHNERPIFQRFVDGSDSSIVSISADTITIPDHYFVTGEKLSYSWAGVGSTQAIGIATSTFSGLTTTYLPQTVYAVKRSESTLSFAASAENALKQTPTVFDITAVGVGTSHSFTSHNQNAKALIGIDNLFQSPVVGGSVTTTLAKAVSLLDTRLHFTGITSFFSGNLIEIDSEIMKINTVGFGSTNVILVDRPWMGTGQAAHSSGALVQIIEGNYNIRENKIHFVEAPYGPTPVSSTTNAPDDRDWTGISTHSTFQGRTFMRNAAKGTAAETYVNNMIFDDISHDFTGIAKTFTLKKDGGTNATGFSTSNGIVLINGIFQRPEGTQPREEDYDMKESSGISSIFFTGTASSVTYDVNNANIPTGGVIVSVGSTEGFGFQPLVAAGGTAVVSAAGTIQSVGMGTSGSGYRLGIQTTVNVAIQTSSLYEANYTGIGTAQIVNGGITGIAITNPHVFYAPKDISNVGYNSLTGLSTITTHQEHGLQRGENINISGIAFTCDYAAPIGIYTADYTSSSGVMTVTTSSAHGLNPYGKSSVVIFTGLGMTCAIDSGVSTHYYPRGHDPAYNNAVSVASTATSTITVNVGVAGPGDQYAHTFKRASTNAIRSGGDYLHQFVSGVTSCVISGGNYTHTFDSVGVTSITVTGIGSITPTAATYNPLTGDMVLTVGSGHTYTTSNTVGFGTSSIVFTCSLDDDSTTHSYPRATDPVIGVNTAITAVTDETITVNVGTSRSVFFDVYDAQYTGSTGIMTLNIGSHSLTTGTSIRLMNNGLSFRCALDDYRTIHTYPRSTDTYYDTAISIAATAANTISLNVGVSSLKYDDVSAATYDPSTGDLVLTVGAGHSITQGTSIGIATESLTFTCARDAHATEHSYPRKGDPTYAGVPVDSVGTTTTFVVNVGTSTVPTFYQGGGKVQAAIIAPRSNSGIGTTTKDADNQDPAYPSTPVVSVINSKSFTVNTGVSTRTHFYARGGRLEKELKVKFDDPLSYSNLDLIYSAESTSGVGTYGKIDIVVGQGSSVIDFEITNTGYGYGQGEILTVHHGGSAGIPTASTPYKEFQITIQETYTDSFAGWTLGDLQVLDNFDSLCDGTNKSFPIKLDDSYITIRAAKGSNIDVQSCLLVFINDILQKPGEAYTFSGGSTITFSEAPKEGDRTNILYYKGTGAVDVVFKDVLETVKVGDELTLYNEPRAPYNQGYGLLQDERVVLGINTTDSVETNPYAGPGVTTDDTLLRPAKWCRQTRDKIINGKRVGKDRVHYEPLIQPTSYLIQNVGVGSTCAWVQNAKPFFDPINENNTDTNTYTIEILSQDVKTSAAATAHVSTAGTITTFTISNAGYGYTAAPSVTIGTPVGLGTTPGDYQAYATATLSSGTVSAITIGSTPGSGYTSTAAPVVLIEDPTSPRDKATSVTYQGDFGIITGVHTTTVGVASTGLVFDLFIPPDSELRDSNIVGVTTVSGIATGYYFTVSNSRIGNGVTSLYQNSSTLGIGSTFIDNVYEVAAVSIGVTAAESKTGAGLTAVAKVTVSVKDWNSISGLGYSSYYGDYSWGKVLFGNRAKPHAYNAYTNDGITGISTGGILRRLYPLKWKNYS